MEEEDCGAHSRAMMGNDILALNYAQKTGVDAGSVDLVGRLKTLSSGRKKLMTKYFDLEEVESGPLLAEYFAVSLAFVALGAMIREANVRMRRKDKENSDGVSPKLQRMALDSMLKSAMERLRALAHRTQSLEEKVRDRSYMEAAFQFERLEFLKRISGLEATIANHEAATLRQETAMAKTVEAETVWRREKEDLVKRMSDVDAQRGYFFKKMAEAEGALADLQRLRMEDGKANAKLVEIYAGREQSWKSERIKMRHEIELLKEKLCKVQPNMNSPRSFDAAAEALRMRNLKRRAKEMVREKVVTEREFAALVESNPKSEVDSSPPVPADERKDLECDIPELSAAQNHEMEAELAIILKRVGALKRRGASGGKLDELLNEAKGKPKLKRLGSFDQPPRSMVIDDTFQPLSEAKDVEIDKEDARDIWQAIEVHEGKSVQRRNGFVPRPVFSQPVADDQLRMSVLDSNPLTPEKESAPERSSCPEKSSSPRIPDWLTVVENDRDFETDAVSSDEPTIHIDDGGWDEFLQENPSSSPNDSVRESWEELVDEKPEINSSSERDGWKEFIQEKLNTLEDNICERTPDGSTVAVESPECWDQDSTVVCALPGPPVGLNDLILFEDDIKSEIVSELFREQPQTAEASASEIDLLSAESGELPGISSAHDLPEDVIKSEIVVTNPTPTLDSGHLDTEVHEDELGKVNPTPTLDSGHLDTEVHEDELGKVNPTPTLDSGHLDTEVHEDELGKVNPTPTLDSGHLDTEVHEDELGKVDAGEIDDVSENGQGQTLEVAEEDLSNSLAPGRIGSLHSTIQQLSPGRTIISGLELKHEELNGSSVATA